MDHGLSHHEIHHSAQLFREDQWSRTSQGSWLQPTVFGPVPYPRQHLKGVPQSHQSSPSTITAKIEFKTSATLLRTLFPNASYKFTKTDTVTNASFQVQTLENLPWLAGGSYSQFALYIHDIQYTEPRGEIAYGSFCPVMFENLTDTILSGREGVGFPKLFSDITITDESATKSIREVSISWRGAEWAKLSWDGLKSQPRSYSNGTRDLNGSTGETIHPGKHSKGLFVHKFIPSSTMSEGGHDKFDVKYDVHVPNYFGDSSTETKMWKAAHAEFKINDLGFQKLPTIHHIVQRLAEVPCFEVVEATIVEADRVADLSGIRTLR